MPRITNCEGYGPKSTEWWGNGCISLVTVYIPSGADPLYNVPPQPVASEANHSMCPKAVMHLCVEMVLLTHAEHVVLVWCVELGALRC
jgi:hypothetical protein